MSVVSMTERVELERGNRKPSEVKELNLDNSKATEIEGLSDKFKSLEHLSLVNLGLQSLTGLPHLPELKKIDLAENRLSGGLDPLLNCPKLEQINLSGNKMKSIDSLAPLSKLNDLRVLDIYNCEIVDSKTYRQDVFALIPHLKYLDGFDENNVEEPVGEELTNGETRESAGNGEGEKDIDEEDEGDDEDEDDVEDASNDAIRSTRRSTGRRKVAAEAGEGEEFFEDDGEEEDDCDEEEDDEDDDDEDDEEVGLEALQNSKDLEDDEEDYAPPEGEEDDENDLDDDDIDQEEIDETNIIANLSGAGVTGSRRPGSKRRVSTESNGARTDAQGSPVSKLRRSSENESVPAAEEVASNEDTNE